MSTETFEVQRQPMLCGSAEAESRRYLKVTGKGGRIWLVADQPNAGDNIYVEGGPGSQGFAGRTLTFTLVSGEVISLKGPWHSNSRSLYLATGLDVRNRHLTFGVIARDREYRRGSVCTPTLVGVIERDEEAQVGEFDRVKKRAQELVNERGERLCYYVQSVGGSSCGFVEPEGTDDKEGL